MKLTTFCTICCVTAASASMAQTSVHWSTLGNTIADDGRAAYIQRFTITNPPANMSRLAFNQFARRMSVVNPADTLIEIIPGYYAVASPRFAQAQGDTVCVDILTRANLESICYAADGAHLVLADGSTAPAAFTRAHLLDNPKFYSTATHNPMPDAAKIYAKNEALKGATADFYAVVPSFKSVRNTGSTTMLKTTELKFEPTNDPRPDYFRATIKKGRITVETNNRANAARRLAAIDFTTSKPTHTAVIEDWPDYPYRGLMIDITRNFQPIESFYEFTLPMMQRYGLNILHFHFADDEAWRLEIPGMPELTDMASKRGYTLDSKEFLPQFFAGDGNPETQGTSANGFYTRSQFIDLLKAADAAGIKVIPEIESPGHARAAIMAMEKRLRDTGDDTYRLIDPADTSKYTSAQALHDNVMNPAIPGPVRFMTHVGRELQKMYAEAGVELPAIHIGGDEVAKGAWTGSPIARAYMDSLGMTNERDLHLIYIRELLEQYDTLGIPVSGWQEIAVGHSDEFNERVRPSVYSVNCWSTLGPSSSVTQQSARGGYPTVLSNVDHFYMDMCYNYHPDERGLTWGGTVDEFDALHGYPDELCPVEPEAAKNIIGVSGQLFSETLRCPEHLHTFLLPKMLGLAERGWNGKPTYTDAEFNAIIDTREIPVWTARGYHWHVAQPGILVENGLVKMNAQYPEAEIRYTLDGSEPTAQSALYTAPFSAPAGEIRAKAFIAGRESLTTVK